MKRDDKTGDLFDAEPARSFGGPTYEPERDFERLNAQLERVFNLMADGRWRSLAAIRAHVPGIDTSISARLRDLRKAKFGGHDVQTKHVRKGLWHYRLIVRRDA